MPAKSTRARAFGEYLKGLRDATGRSLREVAPEIGVSFPHLGRIERGEMRGPPSVTVLNQMSAVYGRPLEEVLERAGVRIELVGPEEIPTGEQQFKRLMLSEEFKPSGLTAEHLNFFPPAFRKSILELASNVERHTVRRMEWEQLHEAGEPSPMRTFAEVIGAGTAKRVISPDWREND